MEAKIALVLAAAVLLLAPFALANDTLTAEVNIVVPEKIVSIQVQEHVSLGNITMGSSKQSTGNVKVDINNTGTVDVFVTPVLVEESEVFSNLYLTKRLSGAFLNWAKVGEWTLDIDQPSSVGGVKKEYFYMKLDLTDFEGEIEESMLGQQAELLFVAVEQ